VYAEGAARKNLLQLVGRDVNAKSSRKRGRRGMNYWDITVLAIQPPCQTK